MILTDYFIASPAELESLRIQTSPASSLPSVRSKGADTVKLTALQRIVGTAFGDPALASLKCSAVGKPTSEGPWLFAVPGATTDALSRLTEPGLARIATQWAETPEWRLDRAGPHAVANLLTELHALARRARADKREMFLWMSL